MYHSRVVPPLVTAEPLVMCYYTFLTSLHFDEMLTINIDVQSIS